MFARLFAVAAFAAFAAFVVAQECPTGNINCCNSPIMPASEAHSYLKQFGINVLADVPETVPVAGGCNSGGLVSVGGSGATCTQSPICCNNNTFDGLIGIDCSPITVNI